MTETSDLTGAGEIVEALGQAWTLSHVGPALRGAFSAWLKGRARQECQGDRGLQSAYTQDLAAGAYNWGSPLDPDGMGEAVRTALEQTEANVRLVQLLLEARHGDVSPEKVIKMMEAAGEALREAVKECLRLRPPGGNE